MTWSRDMNIAIKIKELRESVGMTRKEFAEYTGIPIRTLEDWEAERRIPPAYVPRLLAYKLKYEKILQKNSLQNKDVNFIEDVDGLKIVLINDIRFKSRRKIDWNQIENILKEHIGKYYEILETSEVVYIGTDFPDEFSHSQDTKNTKGANEKAKANTITAIGELIEIAYNKAEYPDYFNKHGSKAKYGWYRYDTRFGLPVYDENGELERYNIFGARILIRRDKDEKLYLYDIVRTKKETSKPH